MVNYIVVIVSIRYFVSNNPAHFDLPTPWSTSRFDSLNKLIINFASSKALSFYGEKSHIAVNKHSVYDNYKSMNELILLRSMRSFIIFIMKIYLKMVQFEEFEEFYS